MNKKILFVIFLFNVFCCYSIESVNILSFGAIPNDGKDDLVALRKLAAYCRENPNTKVLIPSGTYDLIDDKALEIEKNAITGVYGESSSQVLFKMGSPYVKALDLTGSENITIEAKGVTFMMHGWYEPVSIVNANNIEIEGLTIRYNRPPNTVGSIVDVKDSFFDAQYDSTLYTNLPKNVFSTWTLMYDPITYRVHDDVQAFKIEKISGNVLRFYHKKRKAEQVPFNLGQKVIVRHSYHYRAGIFIKDSKNVILKDIYIHDQCGMGVVGHRSENITLNNLHVVPLPGRYMSSNTDATHFTDCKGFIKFEGCKFEGQGDDCTNIHGYYYFLYPTADKRKVEIKVEQADLHALSLSYPDLGDTLALVDKNSYNIKDEFNVVKTEIDEKENRVFVVFDKDLPVNINNYYMYNKNQRPSVEILNCTSRSHRARAYLIKTNNVHIKGCVIQQCAGGCIQLGAEYGWKEGAPVENIIIENNCFFDASYEWGNVVNIGNYGGNEPSNMTNKNILIQNNVIRINKDFAFDINDSQYVIIRNNKIFGCKEVVNYKNSANIELDNNEIVTNMVK